MPFTTSLKDLKETEVSAVAHEMHDDGTLFLDFGKDAFGTVIFDASQLPDPAVVHLGEKLNEHGRIDREPPGCIRYKRIEQRHNNSINHRVEIPPDERNTGPAAIKMPSQTGEVFPFRYVEIESAKALSPNQVTQIMVHYPFDDDAASFESSDETLNAVWELCKYSIKATSFCGIYVDGDRERIPYEGDAYINQLSHYCVDQEYEMARYSHEYLIQNPTWPTEWHLHSVMMAWADYLYSGETASLKMFYEDLCVKSMIELDRGDGLISTQSDLCTDDFVKRLHMNLPADSSKKAIRDLVDWPPGSFTDGGTGERDNHEMLPVNTVVNAFHCHVLSLMSRIAKVLDKTKDTSRFFAHAQKVRDAINERLFDEGKGIYIDGEGSEHASLHSNMFMLAFDLVPEERKRSVIDFVKSRGMACSVYGAQHLLDGLYAAREAAYALELMTAKHDRSWWHMLEQGSTITLEAWDLIYKKNLDWNHAWGAAPANIIPRYIMGVRPLEAGFERILIDPQIAGLAHFSGKVPTPRGPVHIAYKSDNSPHQFFEIDLPPDAEAYFSWIQDVSDPRRVEINNQLSDPIASLGDQCLYELFPGKNQIRIAGHQE